jgi:hypothetical protein
MRSLASIFASQSRTRFSLWLTTPLCSEGEEECQR